MKNLLAALGLGLATTSLSSPVLAQNDPISNAIGTAASAANGVLGSNPGRANSRSHRRSSLDPRRAPAVRGLSARTPRAVLTTTADGYMNLPLDSFLAVRRVHPPPYDWAAQGCSFGEATGPFRESFNRACNRHEFGYRNYGGRGLALDRTEARRTRVDDRLREDLNGLCRGEHSGLTELPCMAAAQGIYASARSAGSNWFMTGTGRPPTVPTPSIPGLNNGGNSSPIPGLPIPGLNNGGQGNNNTLPIPGLNGTPLQIPGLQRKKSR